MSFPSFKSACEKLFFLIKVMHGVKMPDRLLYRTPVSFFQDYGKFKIGGIRESSLLHILFMAITLSLSEHSTKAVNAHLVHALIYVKDHFYSILCSNETGQPEPEFHRLVVRASTTINGW